MHEQEQAISPEQLAAGSEEIQSQRIQQSQNIIIELPKREH